MTQWHLRSRRKESGKLLHSMSKKKKRQRSRDYLPMHIGEKKIKKTAKKGGGTRLVALSGNVANIMADGKAQKTKIITVLENAADSQFVRRNIITRGAVIDTELGKARVTSRPGRDGTVNAVLIEKKK